jgi:RHS repeat-associated protein
MFFTLLFPLTSLAQAAPAPSSSLESSPPQATIAPPPVDTPTAPTPTPSTNTAVPAAPPTSESPSGSSAAVVPATPQGLQSPTPLTPGTGAPALDLTNLALDSKFHSEIDPVSGSLVYTYPIDIPPGRSGLQPNVDLKYTSQPSSNVNVYGYGWDSGIPYIERINKKGSDSLYSQNYYYSSTDGEIYQTAASSSTWGARVENGAFNKYQLIATSSSSYWTVTGKNGVTYTFGTTTAAQENNASTTSQVYKWMLQEARDANGNYVSYQYTKDRGKLYPSKITYTNASSTPGIFEIDYAVSARPDVATSTAFGFPITSAYRISDIQVKVNGVLTRDYSLGYSAGNNTSRSLLSSITQSGYVNGSVTTLPPVQFTYTSGLKNWNTSTTYTPPVLFDSNTLLVDVNGDSLIDFVQANPTAATSSVYINNGTNWIASSTLTLGTSTSIGRFVDVNGDHLADQVVASTTFLNTGGGWTASSTWILPSTVTAESSYGTGGVQFADVNGDGLIDIVKSADGGSYVYLNNGTGWTLSSWTVPVDFVDANTDNYVRIEDVNGDGLPDLVQSYQLLGSSNKRVWINNGTGWTLDPQWNVPVYFSTNDIFTNYYDSGVRFADINGDGLPDIIQNWGHSGTGTTTSWLNTGSGWVADGLWQPPILFVTDNTDEHVRIADVNGDNLPDLILSGAFGSYAYVNRASTPDLLSKVTFVQGGSSSFSYEPSQLYLNSGGQLLNPKLPLSIDTVSGQSTDNGLGVLATSSYSYQGGQFFYGSPFNRQFAGFQNVVKTDALGNVTKTYYHQGNVVSDTSHGEYQDDQSKIGKTYRVESYDNASNLYKKSIFKWDETALSGSRAFVDLLQELDSTYDASTTHKDIAISNTYDSTSGALLGLKTWGQVTGNDDGTFTDIGTDAFTASTTYATNSLPYLVLPSDQITTAQAGSKISEQQLYYDSSPLGSVAIGNVTKLARWISGTSSPVYASTTSAYNSLGLVTSQKDARGNISTYGYDSASLYVATTTNALSQVTYKTYDYNSGKVSTTTDPNGSIYVNTYDGLGRLITQYQPDTTSSSTVPVLATQYVYNDTALPSVDKIQYLSAATSSEVYAYFDGLGRIIQSRTGVTGSAPVVGPALSVSYLVVGAGGGGGGGELSGGGGAGGYQAGTSFAVTPQAYTITVGSGGSAGVTSVGGTGGNSIFATITAYGGGGGAGVGNGVSGGSGGGGSGNASYAGGAGSQGNSGGGSGTLNGGGGGGGASAAGNNGFASPYYNGGNGGAGTANGITGTSLTYAGGGGGGASPSGTMGSGGAGGGGAGGTQVGPVHSIAGTNGLGGGGGGEGVGGTSGSSGGSGVVIISYPTTDASNYLCGGTVTTTASTTVCQFTANGTFTVPGTIALSTNDYATKDYQYNNIGLLSKVSLPYFSNQTGQTTPTATSNLYTSYTYDPVYRIKSLSNAVGSTGYAYNNWVTTITDPNGHTKDLTYDAYQNLVGVTEHNGASAYGTTYAYDGNKNLLSLTDASGNTRAFTYDGVNDELTAQDLHVVGDTSFGTWSYGYDVGSNKTSVVNPNSQTIQYTYDALNRPLTEDYVAQSGIEKTYVYDACSNGIGQLCSAATASATTTYAYDAAGHPINEMETIAGGNSYASQYVFDRQGNVTTQTYPDGAVVNYKYDNQGRLNTITEVDAGTTTPKTIVADLEYGPDGQVTYQRDGNSVETFNTYDPNALYRLTYRKTVGPGTGHLYSPMQSMLRLQQQPVSVGPDLSLASPTNPVEVLAARSATSRTFALGKGPNHTLAYATEFHAEPQFAPDASGAMVPIDSLSRITDQKSAVAISEPGYAAQVVKNPTSTLFTYTGVGGGISLGFSDTKASVKAPVESISTQGTVFTYSNVLGTGENLELIPTDSSLQKNLVLTKEPAKAGSNLNYTVTFKIAATSGTGAIDVQVDGKRLSVEKTIISTGEATILSANGTIAYIWPPSATDSTPNPNPAHRIPISLIYQLKSDGIYITKQIPYSWLDTATYPVRADLTFSGYAGSGDGVVGTQPYPGSWSTQHADLSGQNASYTGPSLSVASQAFDTSTGYEGIVRAFIPIDTSSLPDNAVISSSTLSLYVNAKYDDFNDANGTLNIYQGLEASPNSIINSDVSKCGDAITNPTKGSTDTDITGITAGAYVAFPLTTAGKSWISATTSSRFCIREGHDTSNNAVINTSSIWKYEGIDAATSEAAGTSKDPYLTISYTVPDTVPSTTTHLLSEDQTNPINVIDPQPRFSGQYNDGDVGDLATSYELQIATSTTGFSSPFWDSGKITLTPNVTAGNQSQDLSYTGSALSLDHTTYYWRIKFWDLADVGGAWSTGVDNFTMADDGTRVQSLHYVYDAAGNITSILDDVNGSEQNTFTYDALNRLTAASSTVSGFQTPYLRRYSYDPLGNISSSTEKGSYFYQGNTGTNYANPDAVTATVSSATSTYTYDNNGNLLSDGTLTNVWDYLNELTRVGKGGATFTYSYDYVGNRVKTVEGSVTTFCPNKYYSTTLAAKPATVKNIYAGGLLVATLNAVGTTSAATSTPLLDATSTASVLVASGTTTQSWTHKIALGTTNRLLVLTADILQHVAGVGSISSASYAGLPLTEASSSLSSSTASELWYLIAPPSGTNTMSVTVNGSTDTLKFGLSDYSNIAPVQFLDVTCIATGTSGNPSIPCVTHTSGDIVVATLSRNSNTLAITNRTPLYTDTASTTLGAASYRLGGTAGSIFDTYTGSTTQPWSMILSAFRAATTSATLSTTTTIFYVHPDHLGGANALTDSQGLLNESLEYYPYGALRADTLAGTYAGTKRKYIGQVYDASSGLNYLNARYQDPGRGQFLSEDPVFWGNPSQQNLTDPQSFNTYSYAEDNPVTFKDPSGLSLTQTQRFQLQLQVASFQLQALSLQIAVSTASIGIGAISAANNPISGYQQFTNSSVSTAQRIGAGAGLAIGAAFIVRDVVQAGVSITTAEATLLAKRAKTINSVLDDFAQTRRTTAVLRTNGGDIVASGGRDLSKAQIDSLLPGETAAKMPRAHAEVTAVNQAINSGLTPQAIGTSRTICPSCQDYLGSLGATLIDPFTATW